MSRSDGSALGLGAVPFGTSAIAGAVAFVVGYVLTAVVMFLDFAMREGSGGAGSDSSEASGQFVEFLGTLFYNAHFLELEVTSPEGTGTTNLLDVVASEVPTLVYQAVPILVLLLAGYLVASRVGDRLDSPVAASQVGASLVVAYLPLAIVGALFFSFDTTFFGVPITIAVPLEQSILRVGLLYPLVAGALGGLGYFALRRR